MQLCGLKIGSFLGDPKAGEVASIEKKNKKKEAIVLVRVFAFISANARPPSTLRWEVTVQKEDFFLNLRMNHCFMVIAINKNENIRNALRSFEGVFFQVFGVRKEEEVSFFCIKTKRQYIFMFGASGDNKRVIEKLALEVKKVEVVWGEVEREKAFVELQKKCYSLALRDLLISFCAAAPPLVTIVTFVVIQLNGFKRGSFYSRDEEVFTTAFLAIVAVTSLLFVGAIIQTANAGRDYSFKESRSFESYQKATRDLKSGRVDFC